MSPHPCDRSALTEALFDGRLGPPEQASAERHTKVCPECAGLLRDLHATRDALRAASKAPLPLEHQRARLGLLRKAAAPPLPRRRPAWQIAVAITAAPMMLLAGSSLLGPSSRPGARAQPAPAASAAPGACAGPKPTASAPASTLPSALAPNPPQDAPPASAPPAPTAPVPRATGDTARPRQASPSAPAATLTPAASAPAASAPARSSSASREFAEAMDSLSRGDFSASAGKLEGFAAAHPRDARVEEALYLEAIALERAGRAADARQAARRYLAAYPEGAHRAQARRIAGD